MILALWKTKLSLLNDNYGRDYFKRDKSEEVGKE